MKIYQYSRISTVNQDLRIQVEAHSKWKERYIQDHPNDEIEWFDFADSGISGKNIDRPDFIKMMAMIEKGKENGGILVVTKLDRLARSLQDLLNVSERLKKQKVDLVVIEQNIDTTTLNGRLSFHILGAFAEFERELIRERLQIGREVAKLKGTRSGKPMHRPKISIDEDGVKHKYQNGWSMHRIARFYKVSITPVRRILNENK